MEQSTTFAALAVCAILLGLSPTIAEQSNGTGPVRPNAPWRPTPAPVIKPMQESGIPKQFRSTPAPEHLGAARGATKRGSRNDDCPLMGKEYTPGSAVQQIRPRAVYREIITRIKIAGGVLALPVVAYYGVPVILDVPELGYVDVPEDEYARIYDRLSSSDSEQVQEAMCSLRRIKAFEEAEIEAIRRGPERTKPDDTQDLSESIYFDLPPRTETRRRRLY
jgi:hypothetical protein